MHALHQVLILITTAGTAGRMMRALGLTRIGAFLLVSGSTLYHGPMGSLQLCVTQPMMITMCVHDRVTASQPHHSLLLSQVLTLC